MDRSLHNKVTKTTMKRYSKVKRYHQRNLQSNKQLVQELQRLIVLEKSGDAQKPVSKNFQIGYLNAVTQVSRLLASIPNVDVEMGKVIMTHLGLMYNRLMTQSTEPNEVHEEMNDSAPASPASSGYYSDTDAIEIASIIWRPW